MKSIIRKTVINWADFFYGIPFLKHEPEKGDSWRECSWSYLMDRLCNQIEDMQNDPGREDYYANIGNYSAMLWYNNKEDV